MGEETAPFLVLCGSGCRVLRSLASNLFAQALKHERANDSKQRLAVEKEQDARQNGEEGFIALSP
jgi:hypothetical protein